MKMTSCIKEGAQLELATRFCMLVCERREKMEDRRQMGVVSYEHMVIEATTVIIKKGRASGRFINKMLLAYIFDFDSVFKTRHKIARTVVQYGLDIDMEDALAVEDYMLKNGEHMQVHYIDLVINEACEKIGKTPKWLEDVKRCWAESQWEEEGEDE